MEGQGMPFNGDTHMQDEFLRLKELHGIKNVIETGTNLGDTTKWLASNFDNVTTIEVNLTYHSQAKRNLSKYRNIDLIRGDSSRILNELIAFKRNNLLIFLDAHWGKNPLMDELNHIANSKTYPVLVIHDFMNPNDPTMGFDTYDNQPYQFDWIEESLHRIYPDGFDYHYNSEAVGARRGCIFVYPKGSDPEKLAV
jgi:hypothetical protein